MKKLFFIISSLFVSITFLALTPVPAHAQDVHPFTASNITYDPNTSQLSFDISNVEHGPIPWSNNGGGMQIVIYDENAGQYGGETFYGSHQFSNLTPYCSATHCSVTLYHSPGDYNNPLTSNSDVLIIAEGNSYNGIDSWFSQTFKLGCIEPSTNTSPQVNPLTSATFLGGGTYSENGAFAANNQSATSWTAMVDYGDGLSGLHPLTLNGTNFSLSNIYSNPGTYAINVCVVDDQGGVGKSSAIVTVNNPQPPSVGAITVSPNPIQTNTTTIASANFTYVNIPDTHTAVWDWGDGMTSSGVVTEANGAGTVSGNHSYAVAGVYPITLTVTDNNGGVGATTFQYLSVYSPTSQSLFSGGQKFTSLVGAYTADSSLTGSVKFSLNYKYQGSVPTSNKPFSLDFNAANLHFNATRVDSLVIANGIGTLRGTGTINGAGTYTFLVVGDGNADTIRIQIKDQSGNVVYDTQRGRGVSDTSEPTTSVTGNIIVH